MFWRAFLCPWISARVVAFACSHYQTSLAFHLDRDHMKFAVVVQRLGTVEKVVLVPQFVSNVLERLIEILGFEWEERRAARLIGEVAHNLIALGLDVTHIGRNSVNDGIC